MFVVERLEAIQYDGSNGSFIVDTWLEWPAYAGGPAWPNGTGVVSDDGETLEIYVEEYATQEVHKSDWVLRSPDAHSGWSTVTDAVFALKYQQA